MRVAQPAHQHFIHSYALAEARATAAALFGESGAPEGTLRRLVGSVETGFQAFEPERGEAVLGDSRDRLGCQTQAPEFGCADRDPDRCRAVAHVDGAELDVADVAPWLRLREQPQQ